MTIEMDRRTALQMLAVGAGSTALVGDSARGLRSGRCGDHRLAERRAVVGSEPALHARRAADLQAGVRPADRPGSQSSL